MKITIFQKAYDWIKNWSAPKSYVDLMGSLQMAIFVALEQIGKEAIAQIRDKIIEVAADDSLSNEQKFWVVFDFSRSLIPTLKDSVINAVINILVLALKNKGTI